MLHPYAAPALDQTRMAAIGGAFDVRPMAIPVDDRTTLAGTLLSRPGSEFTVVYFGGNGFTSGTLGGEVARFFAPLPVDVLFVDYRGYGTSQGTPSIATLGKDGLAAFEFLTRFGLPAPKSSCTVSRSAASWPGMWRLTGALPE